MGERALGWGLRLLEVALLLGPILVAFAVHGWDYKAVVTPSPNPLEKLRLETPEIEIGSLVKVNDALEATASLTSPFDFAFTIKSYSGEVFCVQGDHNVKIGSLRLKEEVEFQPRAYGTFTIRMELIPDGWVHLGGHGFGAIITIEFRDVTMKVEIFGIYVASPPVTQRTSIRMS